MKIKKIISKLRKKGNITIIVFTSLLLIEVLVVSFLYWRLQNLEHQQIPIAGQTEQTKEATPTPQWQISLPDTSAASVGWISYEDKIEGFKFKYPTTKFTLKPDSLEELDKREPGNKSFSQNLLELKNVTPPKVIKALRFDNGDYSLESYFTPFSLWIFDNPDGLTTDQWYEKYSYFPMLVFNAWGQLTDGIINIDGQTVKYNYHRFFFDTYNLYLSKGRKIYLLHIEREPQQTDLGLQILSTFTFFDPKEFSVLNSSGVTTFKSKYLKLSFRYPSSWGQIEEDLRSGTTGKAYNLTFNGNVGSSALGFGSITSGGRTKDFSESRGGYIADAATGFSSPQDFCNSYFGKQGVSCETINQNIVVQLVVPKYEDVCPPNPGQYWFSKRVWVNLPEQEVNGFMLEYSNFWSKQFTEMSSANLDCSKTDKEKFETMVSKITEKLKRGNLDQATKVNLDGFDSFVKSIDIN